MRKIRVVREGISRKVVASALSTLVAAVAVRYGIELDKSVEVILVGLASLAAGYIVPEEEA